MQLVQYFWALFMVIYVCIELQTLILSFITLKGVGQTQRQWLLHSKFGHDLTEENYISFHRTAAVKVPHICVMATSENG
jgi:hypothetical protein